MGRRLLTFEHEDPNADVLVVTSGWPNEDNEAYCIFIKRQMETVIERGVRCDVLFIRGYRSALAYPFAAVRLALWSLGARRRYRFVHAHSGEAALAAGFYSRAPLLVSYLGDDLLGTPRANGGIPLIGRIRRAVIRQHARVAARTITKSRQMEATLPKPVQRRNTILPNGVDTDLFRPMDRAAARRALGWDRDELIALFAADPELPVKQYWLAQAAVESARIVLPKLRLEVVRGVTPNRIPLLMNAADCLLLTSFSEGSPNVVKEALMCNLPVVATAVGDVPERLGGVMPSYVCEPSPLALSAALTECLSQPSRSNGRKLSGSLDARLIADSLLSLYMELTPELHLESKKVGGHEAAAETNAA